MNLNLFRKSKAANKPHFLLLGNPVSHSLSPLMHNKAADYFGMDVSYHAIRLEESELGTLAAHFNSETFRGANITIPYKEVLINYVDELDRGAREIGAINTIVKSGNTLAGYNTDIHGFISPLRKFEQRLDGASAVVFGTGGAAKAIITSLRLLGVEELIMVSRRPHSVAGFDARSLVRVVGYDSWSAYADHAQLVVNATPLGMHPDTGSSPVSETEISCLEGKICYDIVYNPVETKFLKLADRAGAETISGLEMLIQQGSRSFELWTGKAFPITLIRKYLHGHIAK